MNFLSLSTDPSTWMAAVACAEAAAAVALAVMAARSRKKKDQGTGEQKIFLEEAERTREECILLVRRADTMPVYAIGNLRGLLNTDLEELKADNYPAGQQSWTRLTAVSGRPTTPGTGRNG